MSEPTNGKQSGLENKGIFGLPLIDGQHSPQNVCLIAFLLSAITGFGLTGQNGLGYLTLWMLSEYLFSSLREEALDLSAFYKPLDRAKWFILGGFLEGFLLNRLGWSIYIPFLDKLVVLGVLLTWIEKGLVACRSKL